MASSEDPSSSARVVHLGADPSAAEELRSLLEAGGHRLEVAPGSDQGLALVADRRPDLCTFDEAQAEGSALDLLLTLHRRHPQLPIVVLSSTPSVEGAVSALKQGAMDYIGRPLPPERLARTIQEALQRARQPSEPQYFSAKDTDASGRLRIEEILTNLVIQNGSDLHLKVGRRPLFRITGELVESSFPPVDDEEIRGILLEVLGHEGFQTLERLCEYDTAFVISDIARFRVNAYKRMGHYGMAFRAIPLSPPTIESLELPAVLKEICQVSQGLVLVTGPTGSGKSTTLAAMIDHLNQNEPLHIVTIEDPIEFVYQDKKSTINQRQLGSDLLSIQEAMRRVLRQDPDVILLGEMRDRETIELAVHAAETGHLVFSTLHTNDAKQTLDRIVDTFPSEAAHSIRSMLSMTLHAVICQRLVRRADGQGRVAAVEVLINTPNIRGLIAEGKTSQIEKAISSSGDFYKMQTFNQTLAKMALSGAITQEEALANSTNPGDLTLLLKGVAKSSEVSAAPEPPKVRPNRF